MVASVVRDRAAEEVLAVLRSARWPDGSRVIEASDEVLLETVVAPLIAVLGARHRSQSFVKEGDSSCRD